MGDPKRTCPFIAVGVSMDDLVHSRREAMELTDDLAPSLKLLLGAVSNQGRTTR